MMSLTRTLNTPAGKRWHDAAYWTLLLAACVVFLVMNILTPFKEDDMVHSLVSGEWSHIRSLGDWLRSSYNKFFVLNGRTADSMAELFCGLLGKPLFNLCNTLVFGLLVHVVSLLATNRRSLLAQAMTYACIGTCFPVPSETMLWLAGSCNYMWSITASAVLLLYLLRHAQARPGWGKGLLLLVLAFLAGSSNEATSFGFLAGMFLYYAFNRRLVNTTVVIALAGYLLGVLFIVSSPGIWERASSGGIVVDLSFKELLYSRCYIVGEKMMRFMVPLAAFALGFLVLCFKGFKTIRTSVWTYLLLMMTALLLVFGQNPERPYAPWVTVSLIITIIVADAVLRRWPLLRLAAIVLGLALSAFTFARGITVLRDYKTLDERVVSEIRSAPAQAILRECPYQGYSRFLYTLPLKSDSFFPNEYTWRAYFDKENVQFVSDSIYDRFHGGRLLDGSVEMPFTSDRPALTGRVLAFPDQDYMLLPLNLDTLPTAYQVGTAYWYDTDGALSEKEKDFRKKHALKSTSDPFGYYPLRFDGKVMMVLPLMGNGISSMELLLDYAGDERVTLYRQAPNPDVVKVIEK